LRVRHDLPARIAPLKAGLVVQATVRKSAKGAVLVLGGGERSRCFRVDGRFFTTPFGNSVTFGSTRIAAGKFFVQRSDDRRTKSR